MRTLAVMNQKGGTGKTTTSVTLAALLAQRHQRTLLIDLDPQGHAGLALAIPERRVLATITDVLRSPTDQELVGRALWSVRPNLSIVPSGPTLAALESGAGGLVDAHARERRLRSWLVSIADRFDVCVIDCSPSIGLLTFNALVASSAVLVPIETSYFALRGAERQIAMIAAISRRTRTDIDTWVVPTMYTSGEAPAERILASLQRSHSSRVAPAPIRRDPAVGEAQSLGVPVTEHKPYAPASSDYQVLADWVLGRLPGLSKTIDQPACVPPVEGSAPMSRAEELAGRARMMGTQAGAVPVRFGTMTEIKSGTSPLAGAGLVRRTERAGGAGGDCPGGPDGGP
ncbi:MAG: hypothetical protein Tsb0013_23860 [Phycisphaerales bacterium]